MANGEQENKHKLNFPDDDTEKKSSSQFIGVSYDVKISKWRAQKYSKHEKKMIHFGFYENEERAARASDTLARKLMANGEQAHKLSFPDGDTEVFPEKKSSSQFIGVSYDVKSRKWRANRYSKLEKKMIHFGFYENEERAARASDTLARKLRANGEQAHKLNFPDDATDVFPEKEKREPSSQFIGVIYA